MIMVLVTKAGVAYEGEESFRYEDVSIEAPRANELLVKVAGVGICHTDLVAKSGAIAYPFPAVLGHEGSGVVQAVGCDVTKVKPGDRVLITFRSCGECDRCEQGYASYCRSMGALNFIGRREDESSALSNQQGPVSSNFFGQSSFAAHALTYERNVVKVDDEQLPLAIMGPLGCGIQTGVGAVVRSLEAQSGSSIFIAGGGAVGLSAVMGAKIQQCKTIILLEPVASRRELALELGATHCIDPTSGSDLAEVVHAIVATGVDYAIDTTGKAEIQNSCLQSLGSKGVLGIVGVSPPGTPPPGDIGELINRGLTIKGIMIGDSDPDIFIPELIAHFKAGRLPFEKMVKTFKLSEINEAVADQHSGGCVKVVLIPDEEDV